MKRNPVKSSARGELAELRNQILAMAHKQSEMRATMELQGRLIAMLERQGDARPRCTRENLDFTIEDTLDGIRRQLEEIRVRLKVLEGLR